MEKSLSLIDTPLFEFAGHNVSIGSALVASLLILLALALLISRAGTRRQQRLSLERAQEAELRLAELLKGQAEMQGRIAAMSEVFGARQAEMNQALSQRLAGMTQR